MYELHKLHWDIRRDASTKERYVTDPDAVLDDYRLEGDLRRSMRALDFKSLYERGVNPYLLYFCAIQLEVDRAAYYAQIRGES